MSVYRKPDVIFKRLLEAAASLTIMSTAMNFGSKSFKPRAPDKGAFPLDHLGECKAFKEKFMKCLRDNSFDNSRCRLQSKEYLECRMENQLMAKEPLEKLGFKDLMDPPASRAGREASPEHSQRPVRGKDGCHRLHSGGLQDKTGSRSIL